MPNLLTVDNHTFSPYLLTGLPILDAGSRGLRLAKWFAQLGHRVIALDPGEDEKTVGVESYRLAIVGSKYAGGHVQLVRTDDLEARYVVYQDGHGDCQAVSLGSLMNDCKVPKWDLIKLNIEGSEYDILSEIDGPVSRQIVFSFHEHTDRARGREECDRIIDRLRQWYDIHNQVWEKRYGCRENYWDVLAIERGI